MSDSLIRFQAVFRGRASSVQRKKLVRGLARLNGRRIVPAATTREINAGALTWVIKLNTLE